jgi:WXG100 family type VII secretion target
MSGTGGTEVTFEELTDAGNMLNRGANDIDQQLSTMRSQLEPIHSSWQGAASGQFQQLWDEWQRSAHSLHESLEGISHLLLNAARAYEENEGNVARMFNQ